MANKIKVTKQSFIHSLRLEYGFSEADSTKIMNTVFELWIKSLRLGNTIQINNLGTFKVIHKPKRTHKGFKQTYSVGARDFVNFKESKKLFGEKEKSVVIKEAKSQKSNLNSDMQKTLAELNKKAKE